MADLPWREPEVTVLILQQRPEVVREVESVEVDEALVEVVFSSLLVVSFSDEPVVRSGRLSSVVSRCPSGVVSRWCLVVSAKCPSLVVRICWPSMVVSK